MNLNFTKKRIESIPNLILCLFFFMLLSPGLIFSQSTEQKKQQRPDPKLHHEVPDDGYVPLSRENQGRSPAYHFRSSNIVTTQVNVDVNGQNIVGDAANEPSIAVDPIDPNKMVIGWRQFNSVTNNFRQAGFGYTTDGGQTWTFPGVIQPGFFRSDPVLDYDVDGNFYYNSLTNNPDYFCKVFKSTDGGESWDGGTDAHGGDKQWMTIDKTSGQGNGHIYAFWTSFFSTCYPGFFTRSTDNGSSFEDCIEIPDDPSWGTLMVAPNGNLYVGASGSFDFVVARSTNAQVGTQIVTWDMTTNVNLDGFITYGTGPNPDGLGGQTSIAIDSSGGPTNGNIYLLCSVERTSNSDPLDVMFARSTNGGTSFSAPVRINDDPGTSAYQWFGTMSVAPNGRIDVIWLDTRDNPGTYLSALYYSKSTDGGLTWSANEKLSDYFDPHLGWPNQQKMGDYFHMVSDNNGARLAWAGTFNGEQDVYYSYITDSTTVPVELVSFTASASANVVTLNWATATEINNHGFEIERSVDKTDWKTIGFKEGKGTTSEPQNYSFTDNLSGFSNTKIYYRLKQIDYNGNYKNSNIVEIEIAPATFELTQNYPNPFNPSTTISYELPVSSFVTIKVFNVLGNEVSTLVNEQKPAGRYNIEFNASEFPSGVYFYKLQSNSISETRKMILLR
jgi:Secretion system C-terminal sorting domain